VNPISSLSWHNSCSSNTAATSAAGFLGRSRSAAFTMTLWGQTVRLVGSRPRALDVGQMELRRRRLETEHMGFGMDQRTSNEVQALRELSTFPLVEALYGRRSRRFAFGDEIPDGPLGYRSQHEPVPLTELERMLVLSAMGGTSGWHYGITRNAHYAPHLSNYAGAAAGRTFPSAAGFHTAELFFTDDSGLYFFTTRDAGALVDPATEEVTPELMVERHSERLRKLSDGRLYLPAEEPYLVPSGRHTPGMSDTRLLADVGIRPRIRPKVCLGRLPE
jgi:hypothetical protein